MNHPDADGARSSALVPEAAPFPRISRDGRTYTFVVRPAFTRFSDGKRVGPRAFARALQRAADRRMASPAQPFIKDIVGARAVINGRARAISGVRVRGSRLTVRLVERAPDLLARLAMPFFCAVPPSLEINHDGVSNPFPSAGPYVIRRWEHRRQIVLERNPHYRGPRPRNPSRVVYTIGDREPTQYERLRNGHTDWIRPTGQAALDPRVRPVRLPRVHFLSFDTREGRPFAHQRLRKAVALVLDRSRIARIGGGRDSTAVDHLLPPTLPGYRPTRIYPLGSNAKALERARELASGLVPASVSLVISNRAPWPERGQFIARALKQIDLEVEVRLFPRACTGGPVVADLIHDWREAVYPDAKNFLQYFFETPFVFDLHCDAMRPELARRWHDQFAAASRLAGRARTRAYGRLDIGLSRDAVAAAALLQSNDLNLFSPRIGCFRPHRVYQVDIAALCLRR